MVAPDGDAEARETLTVAREVREAAYTVPSLRYACRFLLKVVHRRFKATRSVVLVRHGDRVEGIGEGVPSPVLDQLRGIVAQDRSLLSAPADDDGESPGLDRATLPLRERLPAGERFRVYPIRPRSSRFEGVLLIDVPEPEARLSHLPDLLRRCAPAFARVAETDALRRELQSQRQQGERLRMVLDSVSDPMLALGPEQEILLANRRANELFMTTEGDSSGRRHAVQANNLYFSAFQTQALLGGADIRELVLVDPVDGADLLFEVSRLRMEAVGDTRGGEVFILRDITDLKRASVELEHQYSRSLAAEHRSRRESERLNVILDNAGVPILVTDERSDIVLMNHEAERLFEHSGADVGTPPFQDVRSNDARITGLISDFLLQPERRREEQFHLTEPGGSRSFPVRAVLTKITNRRDEPTAVVSVLHDLTEEMEVRRLADELHLLNHELEVRIQRATREVSERNRELERQREELARASQLKTEFLAMMSHELRTPIHSILGHNALLREGILGSPSEDQKVALEKMHRSSEHLLTLINDILDLSKVEAGKLTLFFEAIEVGPFLETLTESMRPMAEAKQLDFALEVAEHLPPVWADPTRLRQVIMNLVSNAVKFTQTGGVRLGVGLDDDGERIRFEVEDTGIGIRPEDLEGIFEGFRQADPFITREHGGTGLGLTICRTLVDLMRGSLSARSVRGEGSVFYFELPAATRTAETPGDR